MTGPDEEPPEKDPEAERRRRGRILIALARQSIEDALGLPSSLDRAGAKTPEGDRLAPNGPAEPMVPRPSSPPAWPPWLAEPGACFVTLTQAGRLRGCIGSIRARRPLAEDVRANACAAAFTDPRFPPLAAAEWLHVQVEISLLSPPLPLPAAASEEEVAALLRPGTDGLVLEYRDLSATFLPQVWEQLPEPRDFLSQLKRKAGLPRDLWSREIRLLRYTAEIWTERH